MGPAARFEGEGRGWGDLALGCNLVRRTRSASGERGGAIVACVRGAARVGNSETVLVALFTGPSIGFRLARIIHGREEPDRQVAEWSPAGSQPSSVRIAPLATEMVNFNAVGVQVGIVKLAVNPSGE